MIRGYWKDRLEIQRQDRLIRWGCAFLAVAILLVLGLVATSHGEEVIYSNPCAGIPYPCTPTSFTTVTADPHPASPRLTTRRLAGDPFIGDANQVHNSPSVHRNWIARHPRVFGVLVIGAASGAAAGIARAQHRGICSEKYSSGYTYVGTCPLPHD